MYKEYPLSPFLGTKVVTATDALFSPFALAVSFMVPAVAVVGRTIATATPCQVVRFPWWKLLTSVGSPVPTAVSSPSPVTAKSISTRASGRSVPAASTTDAVIYARSSLSAFIADLKNSESQ